MCRDTCHCLVWPGCRNGPPGRLIQTRAQRALERHAGWPAEQARRLLKDLTHVETCYLAYAGNFHGQPGPALVKLLLQRVGCRRRPVEATPESQAG